jgi:hypothetical protein
MIEFVSICCTARALPRWHEATRTAGARVGAAGAAWAVWLPRALLVAVALAAWAHSALAQAGSGGPAAERRVALVIGNADYPRAPLVNPVNDAADLSAALRRLGFEVIERQNRNADDLRPDLAEFQDKLGPGSVGLFYFADHGVQAGRGGKN